MTAKARKTSATIGLLIEQKRDNGYFHIYARPVWVGLTPGDMEDIDRGENIRPVSSEQVRHIGDYQNERVNGLYYDGLCITSQGNCDDEKRHLYGWEPCFENVYRVRTDSAVQMAKTLTTIDKRFDRLRDKYGYPGSFSNYLLRIADVIGASKFVFQESDAPRSGRLIFDLPSGANRLDGMIGKWITEREQVAS